MREIKFRGLTEGGTCVYGDLINYENGRKAIIGRQLSAPGYLSVEGARISPVKAETVSQFTGLQDKKGSDIYEDDICTVAGIGLAIVDICPYNGTQFKTLDGYDVPVIDCVAEDDDFEIVGNIHQHPELLEQNDE